MNLNLKYKINFQLVILLFFFCTHLFAQNKDAAKNNSDKPFYKTKQTDLLYIGIENPFTLYKKNNIETSLSIENGILLPINISGKDSAVYTISVNNTSPTLIHVKQGDHVYTYKFRNREIPSPVLTLRTDSGYKTGGTVSKKLFNKAQSFVLLLDNFDYDIALKIISYSLTTIKKYPTEPISLKSNVVEQYTKTASSGDIYIFHDVIIEIINTKEQRTINGATFFVK